MEQSKVRPIDITMHVLVSWIESHVCVVVCTLTGSTTAEESEAKAHGDRD